MDEARDRHTDCDAVERVVDHDSGAVRHHLRVLHHSLLCYNISKRNSRVSELARQGARIRIPRMAVVGSTAYFGDAAVPQVPSDLSRHDRIGLRFPKNATSLSGI
jgi:hypothetical protein